MKGESERKSFDLFAPNINKYGFLTHKMAHYCVCEDFIAQSLPLLFTHSPRHNVLIKLALVER